MSAGACHLFNYRLFSQRAHFAFLKKLSRCSRFRIQELLETNAFHLRRKAPDCWRNSVRFFKIKIHVANPPWVSYRTWNCKKAPLMNWEMFNVHLIANAFAKTTSVLDVPWYKLRSNPSNSEFVETQGHTDVTEVLCRWLNFVWKTALWKHNATKSNGFRLKNFLSEQTDLERTSPARSDFRSLRNTSTIFTGVPKARKIGRYFGKQRKPLQLSGR